jgi:hypothetical protein
MVGVLMAALMVNVLGDVVPVSPFTTVTCAVPAVAILVASIDAVRCVAPEPAVAKAVPFHLITAPESNPVPFTVRVNVAAPAVLEAGLRLLIVGVLTGLVIVNGADWEARPGEFVTWEALCTWMRAVPAVIIIPVVSATVRLVGDGEVGVRTVDCPFTVTTTFDVSENPVPVITTGSGPAVSFAADEGARLVITGSWP